MIYEEIEDFVSRHTADEVVLKYSKSTGDEREDWEMAIMTGHAIVSTVQTPYAITTTATQGSQPSVTTTESTLGNRINFSDLPDLPDMLEKYDF